MSVVICHQTMACGLSLFVLYTLLTWTSAGNIALDKPAYQTGVYAGATADRAVDGRYDRDTGDEYYLSVCAHPDTSWYGYIPAMWWVDLEATYNISTVTVWNTYNTGGYWRMNNFTVEVVTSDNTTRQGCGVYSKPDPVSHGGNYTFNCNNTQGRYVYVRRLQGYREQQLITLCEVNVEGFLMTTTKTTTTTTTTRTTINTTTTEAPPVTTISTTKITTAGFSGENTETSDTTTASRGTTILPWVLLGVSFLGNILSASLYFISRARHAHGSKTTSHTGNSTQQQDMTTYTSNSLRHQDGITRDQQIMNTSNMDNVEYEDVKENVQTTQQYQSLHGQAADYVNDTHYERIKEA